MDQTPLRLAALDQSIRARALHPHSNVECLLEDADKILFWLATEPVPAPVDDPVKITLAHTAPVLQGSLGANDMQLDDTQKFTLTATETDAKGATVSGDVLTWTVDNGSVVSLVVSADTQSCDVVAGSPGTAVVTVADANGLSATSTVVVVAGPAAVLTLTEGTAVAQ